jgi:hypothetical protein
MFKVFVQPKKNHVNANHLSRLNIKIGKAPINDSLLDAALSVWEVFNGEYVDVFNYLSLHQFPNGLLKKKKKIDLEDNSIHNY